MSSGWSRRISKPQTEVGGPEREKVLGKPRVIDGPGEAGLSSQVLLVGTEIRKARGKSPHADHSFSRGTAVTCGQQAQCRHLLRRLSERRAAHPIGSLGRSEEHTSELQSLAYLVCRLLLEKKKKRQIMYSELTRS